MWNLSETNAKVLDYAMAKIKSVPYGVTARWVFYQLVQAGLVEKKKSSNFEYLVNRARKSFYGEWHPNIVADSIRQTHFKGEDYIGLSYLEDSVKEQDYYVQLWFEAEAMYGQFEYYTGDFRVSLVPFRGDVSIPIKWKLAKKLEQMFSDYGLPIKILYFGDRDDKGEQILESAIKDIQAWCKVPFDIERIGLTLEQAHTLDIPDNPDRPGSYQWEALNDQQAANLILTSLGKYQKKPSAQLIEHEKKRYDFLKTKLLEAYKELEESEKGGND